MNLSHCFPSTADMWFQHAGLIGSRTHLFLVLLALWITHCDCVYMCYLVSAALCVVYVVHVLLIIVLLLATKQITLWDNKDFLRPWTVLHGLLLNSKFWLWLTSFVFHDFIMFVPLVTKLTDFRYERHGLFKITLELSNINTKSKILTNLYGDWEQKINFHPLRIFALCSWSWEVVSSSQKDRQTLVLTFKV